MPENPETPDPLDEIPDDLKPSLLAWRAARGRAHEAGIPAIAQEVLTDYRYEALLDAFAQSYVDTGATLAGIELTDEEREVATDRTKIAVEVEAVTRATAQLVTILDRVEEPVEEAIRP